jgi:UDP-3-O-[3-hydroxymyristoyl] N-acetylglucosamine deacetylase
MIQPSLPLSTFLKKQATIKAPISFCGVGVHSAALVNVTVLPSEESSGIYFVRVDKNELINNIPARFSLVSNTMMSTTLENAHGVKVSTVEHLMSALAGHGITNARIEIDDEEMPIMDGSAALFSEMILKCGVQSQYSFVQSLQVLEAVAVRNDYGSASFLPSENREINFALTPANPFYDLTTVRSFTYNLDKDNFDELIADARTFGLFEDAEKLQKAGLARGASLDNTVIYKDGGVMNPKGLRSEDELVRHKVLDALGDLSLAGVNIYARFESVNGGHSLNNLLLRKLLESPNSWRFVDL